MQQFPADSGNALCLQVHNAMLILALVLGFLNDSILHAKTATYDIALHGLTHGDTDHVACCSRAETYGDTDYVACSSRAETHGDTDHVACSSWAETSV